MTAPKKYTKVNGVMKLNPEYKKWKEAQNGPSAPPVTTVAEPEIALPVISSMDDHMQLNEDIGKDVPLAESTDATIEMMQEPEICLGAGMQADEMVDKLGSVMAKYEVPIGLMNKLMMLSEFKSLEFMIDDSGSMQCDSDTMNKLTNRPNTRWEEAQIRLKDMVEVLAYVPFQQIEIFFLNRHDRLTLTRQGRPPEAFLEDANLNIDRVFLSAPMGGTPVFEKMQQSFTRGQGSMIARYFFGDGTPDGGLEVQRKLVNYLKNRQNPSGNPVTFISCTNDDDQVEWMKDAEEVVPFCSESDDFKDESREVLRDQGPALPYTKGFHLVCQLVAAMNPDDLDAMDESVPFTKATLDNLLGLKHNDESYRHYFNNFLQAQKSRKIEGPSDQAKKDQRWNIEDFIRAPVAKEIPMVKQFKQKLLALG